ncbi:MAG: thiamine diphosphokinase [Rhizobiaceae bacterium]|nr:thiamine diphosphokinase [Rhizobiaceae bacterium]MCV0407376.1 thiamine diphosphokinase [Rhizobiaceae bacterium]
MSLFLILLGGELTPTDRLSRQIAGARIIAADSGIAHAGSLGVEPELWVGDFDSTTPQMATRYESVPRQAFPSDKDLTDGEIAIDAALALGAGSILLAGAFGGARADHAYLHLAAGLRLAERGIPTLLTDGRQEGCAILQGMTEFGYAPGTIFSVACFSDLSGLSISGAKWPLDRVEVPFGSSLTLSNEVTGRLEIGLRAGRAMLIAHPA